MARARSVASVLAAVGLASSAGASTPVASVDVPAGLWTYFATQANATVAQPPMNANYAEYPVCGNYPAPTWAVGGVRKCERAVAGDDGRASQIEEAWPACALEATAMRAAHPH
jgi:hypothetical protein